MKTSKALYLLEGEDYSKAMTLMGSSGYDTGVFIPQKIKDSECSVLHVDHEEKRVSIFPLEVYAPDSPTRNDEKFKYYTSKCGDWDDFMKDLRKLT